MERLLERLDTLFRVLDASPWWVWPSAMVALALGSVGASLFFQPLSPEWVAWPGGGQLGDTCGMILLTGLPCPQCGMTRSWVHGVRGHWAAAFAYNPAGLLLLLWIVAGGFIGAIRLVTRDPHKLRASDGVFFGWIAVWFAIYAGGYALRLAGWNPLP